MRVILFTPVRHLILSILNQYDGVCFIICNRYHYCSREIQKGRHDESLAQLAGITQLISIQEHPKFRN